MEDKGLAIEQKLLHAEDVEIQGSLCVGFDCTSSESFGFDTIRMKENNTRLKFQDTSSSGSLPSNDWQLTANDSSNGGANKFSIDDITNGKTPFTIEAGAPSHALYVDDAGNIGVDTSAPVVELHIQDGDSPTLRLEQDGSSGFTAQTWDLAGNETNFFVRDVNHSSNLPFRIKPGSGNDDALVIAADGDVGMGTDSPSESLHVRGTDGNTALLVEEANGTATFRTLMTLQNNGGSRFVLSDTNSSLAWNYEIASSGTVFRIDNTDDAGDEFILDNSGNLTIQGSIFTGGGTCGGGCDRVFQPEYELESIDEHAELMWENSYLPSVGPTPEGAPMNLSDKAGRMLNELEKAHIYIERLHQRLSEVERMLAAAKAE